MPATIPLIIVDMPNYKIFTLSVLEDDPVTTSTALTFTGVGMTVFNGVPQVVLIQNMTNAVDAGGATTGACELAIDSLTTIGFNVINVSASPGVTGIRHVYRVYMSNRAPIAL